MGCDITIFKSSVVSEDETTKTTQIRRTEILDWKSWELGELLVEEMELHNGCTTTVNPEMVINCLQKYLTGEECSEDSYFKQKVEECIAVINPVLESGDETISVNVWY